MPRILRSFVSLLLLGAVACKTPGAASRVFQAAAPGEGPKASLTDLCERYDKLSEALQITLNALFQPFLQAANASSECGDLAAQVASAKSLRVDLGGLTFGATDLAPLASAVAVTELSIIVSKEPPANFAVLEKLPSLRKLQLRGFERPWPKLAEALGRLPQLTYLTIFGIHLDTLVGLEPLTSLRTFYLTGSKVTSIAPLAGATSMEDLQLADNPIESLDAVASMLELKKLVCTDSKVEDLTPLMAAAQVTALDLRHNPGITNILAVQYLPELRELNLGYCKVSNLEPLKHAVNVWSLDLAENPTKSIAPLTAMPRLTRLNVDRNQLTTLAPLLDMPMISSVNAQHNDVGDLPKFPPDHPLRYIILVSSKPKELCRLAAIKDFDRVVLENDILTRAELAAAYGCTSP